MSGTVKEDGILLREIAEDSHKAFDELYLRYSPLIKSFAHCLLKNAEESLDVCQNVFLKIWKNRKTMGTVSPFKPYLYVMVRNQVLDMLEKKHPLPFSEAGLSDDELSGWVDLSSQDRAEYAERLLLCRIALETMPEKRKRLFYLSRRDHLTYQEIARKEGLSVKTVEYHISKALQDLRNLLQILILFF